MHSLSSSRRDGRRQGTINQQGQALVYGIFMLLISLLALFALFNTGQLSREKTKLVDTADAVAYSAGLLHARALNFDAYSNRAMIANEVTIAQLVSIGSWAKYVKTEGDAYNNCLPCEFLIDSSGLSMFDTFYENAGSAADNMETVQSNAKKAADVSDKIVQNVLIVAQDILYDSLVTARNTLMQKVADANYEGQGPVTVDLIPIQSDLGTPGDLSLESSAAPFIKKYKNDERTRFADVVKIAAYKDSFVKTRNWGMVGTSPSCIDVYSGAQYDWMTKRGGTEMIGFDEWKAMDTLSWWQWNLVPTSKVTPPKCVPAEVPIGYGAQPIYKDSDDDSIANLQYYSFSRVLNPLGSLIADAKSEEWKFSGLPSFYDLTSDMLKKDDPRLRFAIRLTREKNDTRTSEANSIVKPSGRLDKFQGKQALNVLAALSASEAFFQRPDGERKNHDANKNEIGSLFNPFWQVHLITPSDTNVDTAYGLQGTVRPQ